jgi:hypothetical protein
MRRPIRRLVVIAIATLLGAPATPFAHPISQGALTLRILSGRIQVEARVPAEEVFVSAALGSSPTGASDDGRALWLQHGDYLLRHLRIDSDGRRLAGAVRGVQGPDASHPGFALYELEYPLVGPPSHLVLEQDVLREIEYAPGNPWEATYVARLERSGTPPEE